MAELDAIYTYAIIGGLVITAVYYGLRLRIEAHKEHSSRASFEAMVRYHSQRLDIEQEKLDLVRKNNGQPGIVSVLRSRPASKPAADKVQEDPLTNDENFFAKIKEIRETYR